MTLTDAELTSILFEQLDEAEREAAVAYLAIEPLGAGDTVTVPGLELHTPWNAGVAFIDQEPMANWSHRCRYVLISRDTGDVISVDAQLPPFGRGAAWHWRVAYKADSVPEAVLPEDLH